MTCCDCMANEIVLVYPHPLRHWAHRCEPCEVKHNRIEYLQPCSPHAPVAGGFPTCLPMARRARRMHSKSGQHLARCIAHGHSHGIQAERVFFLVDGVALRSDDRKGGVCFGMAMNCTKLQAGESRCLSPGTGLGRETGSSSAWPSPATAFWSSRSTAGKIRLRGRRHVDIFAIRTVTDSMRYTLD